MGMMRTTIALLALAQAVSAQNPAPAGESAEVWSAYEAQAFAYCQRVATAWKTAGTHFSYRGLVSLQHLRGYNVARFEVVEGGLELVPPGRDPARMYGVGKCLFYVVPANIHPQTRRMFCVRGDGVAAFTDNVSGVVYRLDNLLAGDGVLGSGGKGDLTEFPRMPGRGRDGNFWQPLAMAKVTTLNVVVVDEDGLPLPQKLISCVPASPDSAVDHLLPAGRIRTTMEGDAKLTGVPARGLGFLLNDGRQPVWIPPAGIKVDARTVRITVPVAVFLRRRMVANESAAIATLKNISSAQSQCQASGVIDANKNGRGEYGMFGELSGRHVVRGGKRTITPPVLSAAFGNVRDGIVARSGYCFRVFLPGKDGAAIPENVNGGAKGAAIDPGNAEAQWCCYAWPAEAGKSGQRTFFINQAGDVLAAGNGKKMYSGAKKAPDATAAYTGTEGLAAGVAANRAGSDKQVWKVVR